MWLLLLLLAFVCGCDCCSIVVAEHTSRAWVHLALLSVLTICLLRCATRQPCITHQGSICMEQQQQAGTTPCRTDAVGTRHARQQTEQHQPTQEVFALTTYATST